METTQIGSQGQSLDVTRVLGEQAGGLDRTLVATPAGADVTCMAANLTCPVCGTPNSSLETFCVECGFLLSSVPGAEDGAATTAGSRFALIEERTGRRFPLHEGANIVGRETGDVLLMEPTVSRRHAQITVTGLSAEVCDLGSTNGTQVDGVPLTLGIAVTVRNGSALRFGNATFRFECEGAEAGPAPSELGQEPSPVVSEHGETGPADAVARLRAVAAADGTGGADIPIAHGVTTIGRRAGNTFVISGDPYVSGRHAEVTASQTGVQIMDVGSTNGTLVNGVKLMPQEPVTLEPGDEVVIGQTRFIFEEAEMTDVPGPHAEEDEEGAADRVDSPDNGADARDTGDEWDTR